MAGVLEGKSAIVTGAGRGIGRAIALGFAEAGADVVVCDLGGELDGTSSSSSPADEVVEEIKKMGSKAISNYADVSDFQAAEQTVKTCVDEFGKVDILANIAGNDLPRMIFNMTEAEWDRVIAVHLKGTFNFSRHASVIMKQQGFGTVINTISDAWAGTIGHINYGASKGGIATFTFSLAREMGKYGVTCNAIAPMAATRMVMNEGVMAGFKKRLEKGLITQERYEQLTDVPGPELLPPAVVYLASDAAKDINGCIFGVGGGKVSLWSQPTEVKILHKNYKKDGMWTQEELQRLIPQALMTGYVNPAPPKKKDG